MNASLPITKVSDNVSIVFIVSINNVSINSVFSGIVSNVSINTVYIVSDNVCDDVCDNVCDNVCNNVCGDVMCVCYVRAEVLKRGRKRGRSYRL